MGDSAGKWRRERRRSRRRFMKEKARDDRRRDRMVTELYGRRGHGECGRKTRYPSRHLAERYAIKYSIVAGKQFQTYHCPYCDGWHLTSHPRKGSSDLMPSEVLERMRESVLRMRAIDTEIEIMGERVGPQGHGYEHHSKSGILDPMRHVISKVDETVELERERMGCEMDVSAGMEVLDGLRALDDEGATRLMTDGEYVLSGYYAFGMDIGAVASGCGQSAELCDMLLAELRRYCDDVGMPRLRAAARRWRNGR